MWPFGDVRVWPEAPILGKLPITASLKKNLFSAVINVGSPQSLQHSILYCSRYELTLLHKGISTFSLPSDWLLWPTERERSSSTYQDRPTLPSYYLLYCVTIHGAVRVSRPLTTLTAGGDVSYSPAPSSPIQLQLPAGCARADRK